MLKRELETLDFKQLSAYLHKRFTWPCPVGSSRDASAEDPGYEIEKTYERSSNDKFRARVREALAAVLFDALQAKKMPLLENTLRTIERVRVPEAQQLLAGIVITKALQEREHNGTDLHARAMFALARSDTDGDLVDLWRQIIKKEPNIAPVFYALRKNARRDLLNLLPAIVRRYEEDPSSINLPLAVMAAISDEPRGERKETVLAIGKAVAQAVPGVRERVLRVVEASSLDDEEREMLASALVGKKEQVTALTNAIQILVKSGNMNEVVCWLKDAHRLGATDSTIREVVRGLGPEVIRIRVADRTRDLGTDDAIEDFLSTWRCLVMEMYALQTGERNPSIAAVQRAGLEDG